jgi:broad specificity phosphatase PhoE
MLGECGVARIIHTEFMRSKQTAKPLQEKLGGAVKLIQIDLGDREAKEHAAEVVAAVTAVPPGGGVTVVIGHSDTVRMIIRGLGGGDVGPIEEFEFDKLYLVYTGQSGDVSVLRLRYGAASLPA